MSYQETIYRSRDRNLLFSALIELTYRCNLDCFFCYNDLALSGEPLALPDYQRLFTDLTTLGCLHLIVSGGEPLSHPDFFAIARTARDKGFVIRLKSNGHALRGALARRVKEEVAPYVIELSLHGASAETHDRQTRVSGSFDRLIENIAELRRLSLRVKLNSTLTRWNEHELKAMFELAEALDVPIQFDAEVTKRDDGDESPLSISASVDGLRRLFTLQSERAAEGRSFLPAGKQGDAVAPPLASDKYCGAGSSGIAIDPFGNVYPCVQWRRSIGNLHRHSILEIWQGSAVLERIRQTTRAAKTLVEAHGPDHSYLGFCPGSAEMQTGDPLEIPAPVAARAAIAHEVGRSFELLPMHPGETAAGTKRRGSN